MALCVGTFTLDDLGLLFNAFGHTLCSLSAAPGRPGELIVDRPDGSSWHWRKGFGRWTSRMDEGILDGWV
jgi:hypothetical protein